MMRRTDRLESFERRHAVERAERIGYAGALKLFGALWAEAMALRDDFPGSWRLDVEADVELARVLNGLPRRP